MHTRRVVVTGGSGYIGQHLVNRLAREGWAVTSMARRPRDSDVPAGVTTVQGDVEDHESLMGPFKNADAVVHLACTPFQSSAADPRKAFSTNAFGTYNVLAACHRLRVRRLVVASTAYVYGTPMGASISEYHSTLPTTPYGASKLAGDCLVLASNRCPSMHVLVLRVFNVFGAAADGTPRPTVEAKFVRHALAGLPVVIDGDPREARDFVHVSDVVQAFTAALDTPTTGVYNVGSGRAYTLTDLALAAGVPPSAIEVKGRDAKAPVQYKADISRATADLAFCPTIDVLDFMASFRQTTEQSDIP